MCINFIKAIVKSHLKKSYRFSSDEYIKTPCGCYFIKSAKRKGILPEILEDLLTARKK